MKTSNLLIIAVAAYGAYWLKNNWQLLRANKIINTGAPINGISEIFTGATKGSNGFGWRYFTDGTAIDPDGAYYLNGVKIWSR